MTRQTDSWDDDIRDLVDAAIKRLEEAWHKGDPIDLDLFLPPTDSPFQQQVVIALMKVHQEHRWRFQCKRALKDNLRKRLGSHCPAAMTPLCQAIPKSRAWAEPFRH